MVDKALCSLIHDKIQFIMATTNQDFFYFFLSLVSIPRQNQSLVLYAFSSYCEFP